MATICADSASNGQWINQPRPIFNVITGTSWAPIVGDEGSFMVLKNGSAQAKIFIPHDDVENFQIGSELHVHQDGTGPVIVEGDPGVTSSSTPASRPSCWGSMRPQR